MLASDHLNWTSAPDPPIYFIEPMILVGVPGAPSAYNSGLSPLTGWNSSYNLYAVLELNVQPNWNTGKTPNYPLSPLITSTPGSPPGTAPAGSGGTVTPSSGQIFPTGLG